MATARIIPLSAVIDPGVVTGHALPVCTVLTPELAQRLQAVNKLTRRLRSANVRIEAASPLDMTLRISAEDAQRLAEAFGGEWRGVSWSTSGRHTLNSVRLGGCRVCWLTPVKE